MPRMTILRSALLCALLSLAVAACGSPASGLDVEPGATTTIAVAVPPSPAATTAPIATTPPPTPRRAEPLPRLDVEVVVPSGYAEESPAPLLLLLHGWGSTPEDVERYLQLKPLAEQAGMLYVMPTGATDRRGLLFWNATPACCDLGLTGVDHSGSLRALIEAIQQHYAVDPERIFIVGASNGGFMAHRMACDHADLVAAVVSFSGAGLQDPAECDPAAPVAVLEVHGDADSVIQYEGGAFGMGGYPGSRETIEAWAARNGCATTPVSGAPLDLASAADVERPTARLLEGAETSVAIYAGGCAPGGHAELWTIAGGEHTPAITPTLSRHIVDFLLSHAKGPGVRG